jgi:hypothetical protein
LLELVLPHAHRGEKLFAIHARSIGILAQQNNLFAIKNKVLLGAAQNLSL